MGGGDPCGSPPLFFFLIVRSIVTDVGEGPTTSENAEKKPASRYTEDDFETLISDEQIRSRVVELGAEITKDYAGRQNELVVVGVLKGCMLFMADLIRHIDLPLACDFLRVSSYEGGMRSTGVVRFEFDLTQTIKNKDVLLVEDIIDTGLTAGFLIKNLGIREPASLKIASLLHKPARTRTPVEIDYLGFTIEDKFVIGYGLDLAGLYRNKREILALRPDRA